jgi:DNA-directed RNA polymerase beta subunit
MALRNFDPTQQFEAIKKSATDAVREIFPVEGKLREIRLLDVSVEDKLNPSDYRAQAQMKLKDGTWGVPVYATLELVDKQSGKALDKSRVKLFTLPKITDRFSYIVGGNEYQVNNQLRLKSGVYTIKKENGELKTQLNLAKGKNFDLAFNERSGLFTIKKIGGGQANIPLYPILTHLGVSAPAVADSWGSDIQRANVGADPKSVGRAEAAFGIKTGELKNYLDGTKISPDTTEAVLGQRFEKVDGPLLLAASKHLLQVHMGEKEPVDRDSLAFKELHSVEDFIHERIQKNKLPLAGKLKRNIDNPKRTKLSQMVNPGAFHSTIEAFFTQDDKSDTPEQTNPIEMLSGQYMATVLRSGGITSDHAIKQSTREIHPSHYGFLDPISTPESSKVGVNLHLPMGITKDGKDLKTVVVHPESKQAAALTPAEAFNKKIAFPGQKGAIVKAQYQGKIVNIPRDQVDYETPSPAALFSWSTNLIPFLASDQGNRAMMASKQLEQAISLKHREAPLVQVAASPDKSFERHIGETLVAKAPADGTVHSITPDTIVLNTKDGKKTVDLYNNFTLNRKSFLSHEPVVKVGDKVKAGQLLADSNFTKDGQLALGTNMRVAYVPYKGLTFEDGIVITESAAQKLTSEHIHKKTLQVSENTVTELTPFKTFYPNAISPENLAKLGSDGVIKKGSTVHKGEVLVTALLKRPASPKGGNVARILTERPKDDSLHWTQEDEGTVLDIQKNASGVTVLVKTEEAARIGDKLAGRHGNKGIITKILPDSEAPHDKSGKPVDVLLNPHGVISRINVGQIYESATGKAALATGKPISVRNFTGEDYLHSTRALVDKAGTPDKEELFDPLTKKSLGKVHVGNPYILKLSKQGTVNFSARQGGPGTGYDSNMQPLKAGGEEGAKAMDLLTTYSMLAHGARANLREMSWLKSTQNDEYWKALKSGQPLPTPKAPFVYDKFMGYLRGAGIDVKKDGSRLTLAPLTDKQVRDQSSGEIKKIEFYNGKDLKERSGGFYDKILTGGFGGTKWNHIDLKEPVVNPVFEKAVSKLTGLGKKYDEVVSGRMHLDPKTGDFNTDGKGITGGAAIEHLLKGIDVEKQLSAFTKRAGKAKGTELDDLNKKIRYLSALKEHKVRPEEAYIRKAVPILPPLYRPIYPLPTGDIASSSINYLYQHAGVLNEMAKLPVMDLLPEEEKAPLRHDINESIRGISGLTDIAIKGRPREGFISEIKGGEGGQPKEGFFLSKLISKKQDFVGRGTVIPEPDLGVDEVGVPEEMAWKLFEPFVISELAKRSMTPLRAKEEIKKKTVFAKQALDNVMGARHVLLNRAPSLHKFSIMALKPKIIQGRAIKVPPLIVKGLNMDFDGDSATLHVPISSEANEEAKKMLPSNNLFKPGTNALMVAPSQEAQVGIFYLSKTSAGRAALAKIIGPKFQIPDIFDKKSTAALLEKMARTLPAPEYTSAVSRLKAAGENHAYAVGFTLGLNDLADFKSDRDKIVQLADRVAKKAKDEKHLERINGEASTLIDQMISAKLYGKQNPLYDMVQSGSRGDKTQLRSIVATPLFMSDAKGKTLPTPIKKSYSEGLDIGDYWLSMYGARKGAIARSIQSSLPGAFSKDVMATTIDSVITAQDCGTKDGVVLKVEDTAEAVDRYTAGDQAGVPHNTLVTPQVLGQLKQRGAKTIKVRSPLTCHRSKGVCAHCHGLDEHGKLPDLGDNVGAKAGQTISEPLIQIVMNCSDGHIFAEDGRVYSFLDFYNSIDAEEGHEDGCYTKTTASPIYDGGQLVETSTIQKHMPEDDMLFFKTKTGHTLLVQANHPLWVYDAAGAAIEKTAEEVVKGDRLKVDISMLGGEEDAPYNPYFMGRYLADGSAHYGNGTKRYKGVPIHIVIHKQDIEIKDKTLSSCPIPGSNTKKYTAVYNVEFSKAFVQAVRGRKARFKRLCPGFNRWSKSQLEELLAGFIDGDSTVFDKCGTTVAQIYTSSYMLLQQIEIICAKLGIWFTPQVVSKQKLQKTPAFVAQLRFPDDSVRKHSIKMQRLEFSPIKQTPKREEYEPITYIKKMWTWTLPVYDVKTSSRGFTCGMVRNHNSRHSGGVAGTGHNVGGYQRIDQLLKLPKILVGSAALAPRSGTVTSITKGIGGGSVIKVGGEEAYAEKGLALKVKVGDSVSAGDAISEGLIKPQDLVKYKGMQTAQQYIADELHSAYHGQGVPIQKRIFETVVRSLGNTTMVLNNPKGSGHVPGDVAPYTAIQAYNRSLKGAVPVDQAVGHKLLEDAGGFKAGHELEEKDITILKAKGIQEVKVEREAIVHAPFLKSVTQQPLMKKDWMGVLGYRYLSKALQEGASQGWSTDLHGTHPIPALAHGAEFGKGKEGGY